SFFFQAEDGIRDGHVTGVQTCALPIFSDSGYCSDANLRYLKKKKIEGFVAVDRESYRDRQKACPRGPLPKGATRVDRMRRKLQTKMGAAIYSTRRTVVEPVFGQIKEARGFRRFFLRG